MSSGAENQPDSAALSGKTVFTAASAKLLPKLVSGLRALGANVLPVAVLEAKEIDDNTALDRAIANVGLYDWIIFTSAWGVSFFTKRLSLSANRAGDLPKICAIGPSTAEAAKDHGFFISLTADEFTAEGIMQSLERYHGGENNMRDLGFLIPRALEARDFLPTALESAGCRVDAIPCYQTVQPEPDAELSASLQNETPDLIVFTSTKAMRNFLKTLAAVVGESSARLFLREAAVAVIGPITADALESEGKSAEIIPSESTVPSLLAAIAEFFRSSNL